MDKKEQILNMYDKLQKEIEYDPIWIKQQKVDEFVEQIVKL